MRLEKKMGETSKIRNEVIQYCGGKGLDLGCGDEKIAANALGIDIVKTPVVDLVMDISKKLPFMDGELDYVYSSHALEHLDGEISEILKDWARVIRSGGFLVLYLPHRDYYKEVNSSHVHSFCEKDIFSKLEEVGDIRILENRLDVGSGRYSFLVVAEKVEVANPDNELIRKRSRSLEKGHEEEDFTADYWLYEHAGLGARINNDPKTIIDYMKDIFGKFGNTGPVLDVGAGPGNIVCGFRKAGIAAEGCEFSLSGRQLALERFGIVLSQCDLRQRLPYEDDQFNWSICIGVLSMIPLSCMANAISEILRVTRFGILVNVQPFISLEAGWYSNPHHLTSLSHIEYWNLFRSCGAYDLTSIQPPQKSRYGIGIINEFAGLFSKRPALEIIKKDLMRGASI